jgi:hypothetical protein
MPNVEQIKAKLHRLEELRKYQSYYGPHTPYPVIVEINDLEVELQQLQQAKANRPVQPVKKKVLKKKKRKSSFWRFSGPTFDAIATIAFIGLVFLFGTIIFATYVKTHPPQSGSDVAVVNPENPLAPTLRPTFTPTASAPGGLLTEIGGPIDGSTFLPTPGEIATEVPTPVPTLTPSATPLPTETLAPLDTPTPIPPTAQPAVAPPVAAQPALKSLPAAAPAAAVPTPAQPTATPAPAYPYTLAEQGNREFQRTNYHVITIYVAVVSEGNVPIGGVKIVGDHVPSGMHAESSLSDWGWSAVNCLDCDYVKQGNVKFEPATFADGAWNIYVADESGNRLSSIVPLNYSADPAQWVWDFIIFKRTG